VEKTQVKNGPPFNTPILPASKRAGTRLEKQMSRYEIIIYWSQADDAFIAEVPELPGCAADGKTHKEALANVEVIIQEWIETAKELGRPIPAPRGRLAFA
jgi:predicted RNase H-like HicB family nuclease